MENKPWISWSPRSRLCILMNTSTRGFLGKCCGFGTISRLFKDFWTLRNSPKRIFGPLLYGFSWKLQYFFVLKADLRRRSISRVHSSDSCLNHQGVCSGLHRNNQNPFHQRANLLPGDLLFEKHEKVYFGLQLSLRCLARSGSQVAWSSRFRYLLGFWRNNRSSFKDYP